MKDCVHTSMHACKSSRLCMCRAYLPTRHCVRETGKIGEGERRGQGGGGGGGRHTVMSQIAVFSREKQRPE